MTTTRGRSYVGQYFGEREIEITPEMVQHYADSVQDYNPWYFGDSPFGGPVAPALLLHSEVYRTLDWYLSIFGNLHARQEFELFAPMMVGDTIATRRQVIDRYIKRDREYVVMEAGTLRTKTASSYSAARHTRASCSKRSRTPRGRGQGPREAHRPPVRGGSRSTRGDRRARKGDHGGDVQAVLDREELPQRREEAQQLGFPDIVVQGMMSLCFISEMMTTRFGDGLADAAGGWT